MSWLISLLSNRPIWLYHAGSIAGQIRSGVMQAAATDAGPHAPHVAPPHQAMSWSQHGRRISFIHEFPWWLHERLEPCMHESMSWSPLANACSVIHESFMITSLHAMRKAIWWGWSYAISHKKSISCTHFTQLSSIFVKLFITPPAKYCNHAIFLCDTSSI